MSEHDSLLKLSESRMSKGSTSFRLASRLLGSDVQESVFHLYSWCRYCDDIIDGEPADTKEAKLRKWDDLAIQTRACFKTDIHPHPIFRGLQVAIRSHEIPEAYPFQLLEGMRMDIEGRTYKTFEELDLYCYRVAGVVGLMMGHILGVSDESALLSACSMGSAMQLTNICRDVREDFDSGRVYLPTGLLHAENINQEDLMNIEKRENLFRVVQETLNRANKLYRLGDRGISALPFRSAMAISTARRIYSAIGQSLLESGPQGLEKRTIVPTPEKFLLLLVGIARVGAQIPQRLKNPHRRSPIENLWIPQTKILSEV